MLRNYLVIAFRNLRKQKLYSFINIFGLAVGIAFCALLFLYVQDELTFDRFHEKKDRIFRVYQTYYQPDGSIENHTVWLPYPLAAALKTDFPEVREFVRFSESEHFVRQEEALFSEVVLYADASVFDVFTFPFVQGDPATALADLNTVVLSRSAARKYFGGENAVGQTLQIRLGGQFEDFTVTGVTENVPGNSSIQFDILLPMAKSSAASEWVSSCMDSWDCSWLLTYVELAPGASAANLEARMPDFWRSYNPDRIQRMRENGAWSGDGIPTSYGLQPVYEEHLDTEIGGGYTEASRPMYSYILGGIGFGVLLIACINFMTLAIGRSASRSREIGLRKVVGANRAQLMRQFWGEALLLSLLALIAGLGLAELFLPAFNSLTGKMLDFRPFDTWTTPAAFAGILLVTGLVAGSYPALVLSGFRPVDVLKNRFRLSGSNAFTRTLVVFQFGLVVFLIMGTLIMLRQLDYMRSRDLGFNREHIVVIPMNRMDGPAALRVFRNELGSRPDILGITGADVSFGRGNRVTTFMHEGEERYVYLYGVEGNYPDVMGLRLLGGRIFDPSLASDSARAVLINQALARQFGWDQPVGEVLTGWSDNPASDPVVIGVVEDFNFLSLHEEVEPVLLLLGSDVNNILVRIAPGNVPATLDAIRATWQQVSPDIPFDYAFLDDDLNRFYEAEQRWSRVVGYSAFFAVLIACLGLFGLAAITAAGRTKEIGIRKVLGASAVSVAVLLSRKFVMLVLIAVVIALPAAYVAALKWLDNFAYRIEIGPAMFILAGALALLIAILTVSYQSVKAALADPVKSLRYE
jgi:putative ABC transport system permease protein